jgi:hypothetical protein
VIVQDLETDEEEIERPLELAADTRSNQEATMLKDEHRDEQRKKYKKALRVIKNPLEREVVRLYHCEEMPIQSDDPNTEDLVRRTGKTASHIRNVLDKGMKVMRKALARSATATARSRKER